MAPQSHLRHGLRTWYTGVAVTVAFFIATSLRFTSHATPACAELFETPIDSAISA